MFDQAMFDARSGVPAGDPGDPGNAGDPGDPAANLVPAGDPTGDPVTDPAPDPVQDPKGLTAASVLAAVVAERRRAIERSQRVDGAPLAAGTDGLALAHERALALLRAAEAAHDPD